MVPQDPYHRQTVVAIVVYNISCLLYGITLKCVGCFGYIGMAANVVERQYLEARTKNRAYLVELMLVVGCEYYLHCFLFFLFHFLLYLYLYLVESLAIYTYDTTLAYKGTWVNHLD